MREPCPTYLDVLIETNEAAGSVTRLDPAWVATLRALFVPLRFPLHVLQMTGLYVGQMAPSSFITNAANFGAADEMRRVQRIAYWTKVLANAHGDELATTALARGAWEDDPAWQPLRRACEQLLVTRPRLGRGVRGPQPGAQTGPGRAAERPVRRTGQTQRR
jgi:toluene monooxygenase system protein E